MNAPMLRDRYELGPLLGSGRGSTTQLATVTGTEERCVIKSLSVGAVVRGASGEHSFDPDDFTKLIELFEREASVLAHLDHPGIPRFIDHFTEAVDGDTRLYTVQEFVRGKTLRAHVEEGRHFTEEQVRDVCRQVAEILAYLHDRSPPLIHRDVKPANVILDEDGTVHLVDFGSVRNAMGGDDLGGKTIVGTYGYMPVEQYEARAVPRSDLYALGMTLVYMLSHKEPTEIPRTGLTLDFRSHVSVSDDFASVIERMIQPAPEDRYKSAGALLQRLSGPSPHEIYAEVIGDTPQRRGTSRGWWAWVGIGGVVLLVGVLTQLPAIVASNSPTAERPLGRTEEVSEETGSGSPPPLITPADGVLTVDLRQDLRYEATGFPMGRAVGQTSLPGLVDTAPAGLGLPDDLYGAEGDERADVRFSYFLLGNGLDPQIDLALIRGPERTALVVDRDNDNDLADEGPRQYNEGSGPLLAAQISVEVELVDAAGGAWTVPYNLWVWFDEAGDGSIGGRFYARNHYRGRLVVAGRSYDVTAFEDRGHDALYRESGVCIDLNGDAECQEDEELFYDGDVVPFPGEPTRLVLDYP